MKIQRFLVLNLALPALLALFIAVARAQPYSTTEPLKVFIVYAGTAIPFYAAAQIISIGFLKAFERLIWHGAVALLVGAIAAILIGYFYLEAVASFIWHNVPWLAEGLSTGFEPGKSQFSDYLISSTSLMFPVIWLSANFFYEMVSQDRLFFRSTGGKFTGSPANIERAVTDSAGHSLPGTFLSKIPQNLGRNLIALEAQEHYVRIHTDIGSDLVLYRFGDAVAELEAMGYGMQVHRSFFVAPESIKGIERSGKSFILRMNNGLEVPVSQSYRAIVARIHDGAPLDLLRRSQRGNAY